jgi:hypothetical protein
MSMKTLSPGDEVGVWLRILYPDGELTPASARVLLRLTFPEKDKGRMRRLSAKARMGTLTEDEEHAMEVYVRAGTMLSILKSKARQVLKTERASHST